MDKVDGRGDEADASEKDERQPPDQVDHGDDVRRERNTQADGSSTSARTRSVATDAIHASNRHSRILDRAGKGGARLDGGVVEGAQTRVRDVVGRAQRRGQDGQVHDGVAKVPVDADGEAGPEEHERHRPLGGIRELWRCGERHAQKRGTAKRIRLKETGSRDSEEDQRKGIAGQSLKKQGVGTARRTSEKG